MIRIFQIINSRLIKGFSVTIYPFFLSVKFEKCYQNQDRESTQQSNVLLACMYSCFTYYLHKRSKTSMLETKKNRDHGFQFLALVFIPVFYPKQVGALKLCVRNKLEPKQHRYMKFVYAIYTMQMCSTKKRKNFFFATFLGHQTF